MLPWRSLHALLGVLATLALLGAGAVDLPRVLPSSQAAAARTAAPLAPQDGMDGGGPALVLRAGAPTAVPAPTSPGLGLLPGPRPHLAPPLALPPLSLPHDGGPSVGAVLATGSRAPPSPAGL